MFKQFDTCETIAMARANGRGRGIFLSTLISILLASLVPVVGSFIAAVPMVVMTILKSPDIDPSTISVPTLELTIASLYATVTATIFFMLYSRFAEKRNMRSLGFTKIKAIQHYVVGLIIGLVMFSAIIGIGVLVGAFQFNGIAENINWGVLLLVFGGFFFQGMSEEVICRGWIMTSVARKNSVLAGVIVNSVIFALLHLSNPGIGILPIINLTLFGVFASVYMLKTDNIWGVSAIHTIWNFVQGSLFGLSVSGMEGMPTIFQFASTDNALMNGGAFGPEGGLIVTVVLVICIAVTMLVGNKKNDTK